MISSELDITRLILFLPEDLVAAAVRPRLVEFGGR